MTRKTANPIHNRSQLEALLSSFLAESSRWQSRVASTEQNNLPASSIAADLLKRQAAIGDECDITVLHWVRKGCNVL